MFQPQKPEDVLKNFQALAGPQSLGRMATLVTDPTFTNLYNLAYATSAAKPADMSALLTAPTPQNLIQIANLWSSLKASEKTTSVTPKATTGQASTVPAFHAASYGIQGGYGSPGFQGGLGGGYSSGSVGFRQEPIIPSTGAAQTPVTVTLQPVNYGDIETRIKSVLIDNYGAFDWLGKNVQNVTQQVAWVDANKNQITNTFSIPRLTPEQVAAVNDFRANKANYDAAVAKMPEVDQLYSKLYVTKKNDTTLMAGLDALLTEFGSTKDSADAKVKSITKDYIDTNIQAKIDAAVGDIKVKVDNAPTAAAIDAELQAKLQDPDFLKANLDQHIKDTFGTLLPPNPSTILSNAKTFLDGAPAEFNALGTKIGGLGTNLSTNAASFNVTAMGSTVDPQLSDLRNAVSEVENYINNAKGYMEKLDVWKTIGSLVGAVLATAPALSAALKALSFLRNDMVDVSNSFNKLGLDLNGMAKNLNQLGAL